MIRRATSPIPIGRTPGHLSSAIRRQATNASMPDGSTKVVQILLATKDNAWHRSVEHDLNDIQRRRKATASRPDGPALPSVFMAVHQDQMALHFLLFLWLYSVLTLHQFYQI